GVSLVLSGQLEGVNRATGGLAEQFFADNTLNPMITAFSQALTTKMGELFSIGGEKLLIWMAPSLPRDTELDIEYLRLLIRSYAATRNDVRRIARHRFGGLPELEWMNDVVIPQTMEERDEEFPDFGIGRIGQQPGQNRGIEFNGRNGFS